MNPWKVQSIQDFNFFCCPECVYRLLFFRKSFLLPILKFRYSKKATNILAQSSLGFDITGIPRFTLLMLGHIKKSRKRKLRKLRLLRSTKGEENRIEL